MAVCRRALAIWLGIWLGVVIPGSALLAAGQDPLVAFLDDPAIKGARVGVLVEDLQSGQRLLVHEADTAQVPASNQKLLVAAAALAHWGPTHHFETPIYADGPLRDGVIEGRLWIEGRGDPSLVSESLWKLAEEIRLLGITEIRDGLGIDQSFFDSISIHPDWEPASARSYHAPTAAFAANYSSFRVEVRPGAKAGDPAQVEVAPAVSYFKTRSDALTVTGKGHLSLSIERLADGTGEQVRISGSVPKGSQPTTWWRSVSDPGQYAVALLRSQLEAQGIKLRGGTQFGPRPADARELLRFNGEPLSTAVQKQNKFSNNFIAEQLTKALGADLYGAPGSWEKGARAIGAHLQRIGLADEQGVIADGSGLSPRNRVSPATLAGVIRDAAARFEYGPEFLASLPLGGLDGTLESRMNGHGVPVRGKTGHLRRVASLSGVLPASSGRSLVFAILVNGARGAPGQVDRAIDQLVAGMARLPLAPAADSAAHRADFD